MKRDNVVGSQALGFSDLGITPRLVEDVLPSYLPSRPGGRAPAMSGPITAGTSGGGAQLDPSCRQAPSARRGRMCRHSTSLLTSVAQGSQDTRCRPELLPEETSPQPRIASSGLSLRSPGRLGRRSGPSAGQASEPGSRRLAGAPARPPCRSCSRCLPHSTRTGFKNCASPAVGRPSRMCSMLTRQCLP
jgi:hypothetical protein